ncbi:MAG: hypothetical protein AABZ26_01565 [Chloroflexota bacterium]
MAFRALVPYALAAVLVAGASSVAVLASLRGVSGIAPESPASASAAPAAASAPRALPELSKTGRLAYWREGRLWISSLDGSLRRATATVDDLRRIGLTRWSPDGSLVAFVDSGLLLAVVTTDGQRTEFGMPRELRDAGYRIADIRWSPDGRKIAATMLRPGDGRSDAFVADITRPRQPPAWTQVTRLDDLFVSDWVSPDEFLAYTAGGVIGVVRAGAVNAIRPLVGALGVSPIIGTDGRIHFLAGRVPVTRDPSLPFVTASRASVWSVDLEGVETRRETTVELNDIRLDGRLPDGRYLVHRGSSSAQAVAGDEVELLPASAGLVERLRIGPDGRTAYGFAPDRIVRLDLAKLTVSAAPQTPSPAVGVFLDGTTDGDVWFPTTTAVTKAPAALVTLPAPPRPPAARYAFNLGGHLWSAGDRQASLLRPGPAVRRIQLPLPRWSPSGEVLVAIEQAGAAFATNALVPVAIDRDGKQTRLELARGSARSFAWSPDGNELAVAVDKRGISALASDADNEIRFLTLDGRASRPATAGNEVAWTAGGLFLLKDVAAGTARSQAIELVDAQGRARPLITREELTADGRASPSPTLGATLSSLDAAADGSFVSVRLATQDSTTSRTFLVVLGRGGAPLLYLRGDNLTDQTWSPSRPVLGYTLDIRTQSESAVVHAPEGGILGRQEGRFAGWSPDGEWYYVARVTGLYAYPLAGGQGVRVSSLGVPVAAARR